MMRAHRWAWEQSHGPIPDGLFVCHRCDVPACVNVEHLFLGAPSDNSEDMAEKKRGKKARTPEGDIIVIQMLCGAGVATQSEIADAFGVARTSVCTWARSAGLTARGRWGNRTPASIKTKPRVPAQLAT